MLVKNNVASPKSKLPKDHKKNITTNVEDIALFGTYG